MATTLYGTPLPTIFDIEYTDGSAGPGVNPYSARGLTGKLSPIAKARGEDKIARTVNGKAIDISAPQMRKYRLEISGNDLAPPAIEGLFAGVAVTVKANVEIAVANGQTIARTAVEGSARAEDAYTYYSPIMEMLVVDVDVQRDEWQQAVAWHVVLEEV